MRRVLVSAVLAGFTATAVVLGSPNDRSTRRDECSWHEGFGLTGNGADGWVDAFAVFEDGTGPALYAGGSFGQVGGVPASNIARWNGISWIALDGPAGNGTSGPVYALTVYDDGTGPALYAGGLFTTAGGVTVNSIARWDGVGWSPLTGASGTGVETGSQVLTLAVYDDGRGPALYVGGTFYGAGGVMVEYIARWDGSDWSPLIAAGGIGVDYAVYALGGYDDGTGPGLYVGGNFSTAGGVSVSHIGRWDGAAWSPLSGPSGIGTNGPVLSIATYDDGTGPALYTGGGFTSAGGVTANNVARWDGSGWSALSGPGGNGTSWTAGALAVFDEGWGPVLFVGGDFSAAGGVGVNRIARWDGTAWSPLVGSGGVGVDGRVEALDVFDESGGPALFAGGQFLAAGGVDSSHIAAWSCTRSGVFADGFERASTMAWSVSMP